MMKLLVFVLALSSCRGQQGLPREVKWDYSEWEPIDTPCPTCRQARVLQAKPAHISTGPIFRSQDHSSPPNQAPPQEPIVQDHSSVVQLQPIIQGKLPKTLKPNSFKTPLVPAQPPRTLAITFPPNNAPGHSTTQVVTPNDGNQVHLVYLPEGSIQQLNSANVARIVPTSQVPQQILRGVEGLPPLLPPQAIQSIEFSDKQKRDHEGRIISGGTHNTLPMSLITTRGHEDDARQKLKLLEAALGTPIEQEEGKLPRVFIAPSHVPPPPGYVKIPLVPQGKSGTQELEENAPLPPTFLTPDARNPPPGFVKFDLPSAVSQLSRDIPVVVPNSQVEPNVIFNGPVLPQNPGVNRPDASLNFQTQDFRTGKNISPQNPSVQVISKGDPKPTIPSKAPVPSKETATKQSSQTTVQAPSKPLSRPPPPQRNTQSQVFPPRLPSPVPQQFRPNPNQPLPFAPRPSQFGAPPFPGQPIFRPGQQFPQPGQPIPQPGHLFPRPGQPSQQQEQFPKQPGQQFLQQNSNTPRPGQQLSQSEPAATPRPGQTPQAPRQPIPQFQQPFQQPNQPFPQPNQPFPQPGRPFSQPGGQTFLQPDQQRFPRPNQAFPPPAQSFPQPGQPFPQPGQSFPQPNQRPLNANPNQSIFRSPHAQVKPDFPDINRPVPNQPQSFNSQTSDFPVPQPNNTPAPPLPSPFTPNLTPETTPHTVTKSISQFSPRPQLINQFTDKQPSLSSPRPPSFVQPSPTPIPFAQSPRFPPRPEIPNFFATPSPIPLIPQSSPVPFSSTTTPRFTTTPTPVTFTTQHSPRPTFTPSPRPVLSSSPRPLFSSPSPVPSSTPRPTPLPFTPRPPFRTNSPFASTPRPPFQQTTAFEDFTTPPRVQLFQEPSHQTFDDQELQTQSFQEPQIPAFQGPQIPAFQEPSNEQSSFEESQEPQIPSFQRPQTSTITRFPGPQSPRIPSFNRPSTVRTPVNENSQETQTPGKRQRLPIFPRFQRPRVTTLAPEEEDQTFIPDFTTPEFLTPSPTTVSPTTPSPSIPTTVKVTTFKPKFNFNSANRRPLIRRKPRPTVTEVPKKDAGEKKTDSVTTIFPPFSVARTLNPLRKDETENGGSSLPGQAGVTVPPAGAFGRRLRPRTKAPSARSEDDSNPASPRPTGQRGLGLVGNRARELPKWLKARRRLRGRFRGSTSTTENVRVVDSVLEDDAPLDILDNNGFSGAESTLVVFSSPPENVVVDPENIQEFEKTAVEEEVERIREEELEAGFGGRPIVVVVEEQADSDTEVIHEDVNHQFEDVASTEPLSTISDPSPESLPEPHSPVSSYEDYSYEETEAVSEPEPEPTDKPVAGLRLL